MASCWLADPGAAEAEYRGEVAEHACSGRQRHGERRDARLAALQSRQREILARYTTSLAAFIADDTDAEPDDLRPTVVAHALIATHQALIDFIHRRLVDGPTDTARLAEQVKILGRDARDLLEHGLAGYGSENA